MKAEKDECEICNERLGKSEHVLIVVCVNGLDHVNRLRMIETTYKF